MNAKLIVVGIVLGAGLALATGNIAFGVGLGLVIAAISVVVKPRHP